MNVRVVVADEREANFFDAAKFGAPLSARGTIENPAGGLKDIDLETDREGRRFGGTGHHHGVDGERSTERHETEQFARAVARRIDEDRVKHEFDKLVIVAGPRMLGLLRQELPETCRNVLAGEIPKDLLHHGTDAIREALPREAFFH
ncbi:MAG: host attachment protein [Steroidobacter sp.]